jgi:SAM-dependent methyltransferase
LQVDHRELAEVRRSQQEAAHATLRASDQNDFQRYLVPASDTPFSLEYAFHLLGDLSGKTVVDLGCGSGENLIPLVHRGAHVVGLDLSPELIDLARARLAEASLHADLCVASAYDTNLPTGVADVILCAAILHHLELNRAKQEILRILRPGGLLVIKEPIRSSSLLDRLRRILPSQEDISEYEHPLTKAELREFVRGFEVTADRVFRLPFIALIQRMSKTLGRGRGWLTFDAWLLRTFPVLACLASVRVMALSPQKTGPS